MKTIFKLCMLAFGCILFYTLPQYIWPWGGDEQAMRGLALLVILLSSTIIGLFWFGHSVLLAEEMPEVDVSLTEDKQVRKFRRMNE